MYKADNIDSIYRQLCIDLLLGGKTIGNTIELNNYSFELTNIDNNVVNIRNISEAYLCGEMLWYMTARNDIDFINKFSSFWGRISDDGITSNSAYGDIIFKRHGFNQVDKIIELLKTDKNSRRAVINLNVPNQNVIETKDEICTIALQFYIRNEKLYCTGIMRSNDIWYGLPYDVAFFTELQKYIAHRLGVECGTYTHFVTSIHVYDRNYQNLISILRCKPISRLHIDIEKLNDKKHILENVICGSSEPKKDIVSLCRKYNILRDEVLFEAVGL